MREDSLPVTQSIETSDESEVEVSNVELIMEDNPPEPPILHIIDGLEVKVFVREDCHPKTEKLDVSAGSEREDFDREVAKTKDSQLLEERDVHISTGLMRDVSGNNATMVVDLQVTATEINTEPDALVSKGLAPSLGELDRVGINARNSLSEDTIPRCVWDNSLTPDSVCCTKSYSEYCPREKYIRQYCSISSSNLDDYYGFTYFYFGFVMLTILSIVFRRKYLRWKRKSCVASTCTLNQSSRNEQQHTPSKDMDSCSSVFNKELISPMKNSTFSSMGKYESSTDSVRTDSIRYHSDEMSSTDTGFDKVRPFSGDEGGTDSTERESETPPSPLLLSQETSPPPIILTQDNPNSQHEDMSMLSINGDCSIIAESSFIDEVCSNSSSGHSSSDAPRTNEYTKISLKNEIQCQGPYSPIRSSKSLGATTASGKSRQVKKSSSKSELSVETTIPTQPVPAIHVGDHVVRGGFLLLYCSMYFCRLNLILQF